MSVASQVDELAPCPRAVIIGTFDGVHVGHRELIRRAATSGLRVTAVTFDPHPRRVLGQDVRMISSLSRRVELLVEAGAEDVLVTPFTPAVADLEAAEWAAGVLMPIGTQHVLVGEGFRFGYRRAGDAAMLRRMRFSVEEVPLRDGVSSSRVRELLGAGNLTAAQRQLGRPPELEGVATTRALETTMATARVAVRADAGMALPPTGIYDARLARADARVVIRDGRVDLLAPADAAPLGGMRVCIRLATAAATYRRRHAGVAIRGSREVSIARAA